MSGSLYLPSIELRRVDGQRLLVARCSEPLTRIIGEGRPTNPVRLVRALSLLEPEAGGRLVEKVHELFPGDAGDMRFDYGFAFGAPASRLLRASGFEAAPEAQEEIDAFPVDEREVEALTERALALVRAADRRELAARRAMRESGVGPGRLSLAGGGEIGLAGEAVDLDRILHG